MNSVSDTRSFQQNLLSRVSDVAEISREVTEEEMTLSYRYENVPSKAIPVTCVALWSLTTHGDHPNGALRTQKLKSPLLRTQSGQFFSLWGRSECSHSSYANCLKYLPCCNFYLTSPFILSSFSFSFFFFSYHLIPLVSDPRNKIGYPAHKRFEKVPVVSAFEI